MKQESFLINCFPRGALPEILMDCSDTFWRSLSKLYQCGHGTTAKPFRSKGPWRNYKGLSEQRYLQFGVIWREFGARDKTASCRKMDQFIFFEDIHEFVMQICRIWGVPIPDYGKLLENSAVFNCVLYLSHAIFSIIKIIKMK